ncbi:MAG: hypothetical protein WCP14_04625 [bacterium]
MSKKEAVKKNGIIDFIQKDYKKIILGGIGIYLLVYVINIIFSFIWVTFFSTDIASLIVDITKGQTEKAIELYTVTSANYFIFGLAVAAVVIVALIVINFEEKFLLNKVSSWKETLFLGCLWSLIFVASEYFMMGIMQYMIQTTMPLGIGYPIALGVTGITQGVTSYTPFFSYSPWYLIFIVLLPATSIAIKKVLKK